MWVPPPRPAAPAPPGPAPQVPSVSPDGATPLRLCLITNTIDLGGAETQALRLCGRLDPSAVRVTLVYYGGQGDLRGEFEALDVELVHFDRDAIGRVRFVRRLARFLRERDFDVVHCWRGTANHYGGLAAVLARARCILTGHRDFEVYPLTTRLVDRVLRPFTAARVVNSEAIRAKHGRTAWFPDAHLRVLYNGLDPEEFAQDETPAEILRAEGLDSERPLLVTIGRLDAPKRQDLFLRLAKELLERGLAVQFALIGKGPDRERLEERSRTLGIAEHVHFLGARRDVPRLLRAATLNVCTSVREGLPNVVLESMMAGTPVVTVDNGGGPELVANPQQVVAADDLAALTERVAEVLAAPETLAAWSRAGRERALEVFTLDVAAARYAALLLELAQQGRPRA